MRSGSLESNKYETKSIIEQQPPTANITSAQIGSKYRKVTQRLPLDIFEKSNQNFASQILVNEEPKTVTCFES